MKKLVKLISITLLVVSVCPLAFTINHLVAYFKGPVLVDEIGRHYFLYGNILMAIAFFVIFLFMLICGLVLLLKKRGKDE